MKMKQEQDELEHKNLTFQPNSAVDKVKHLEVAQEAADGATAHIKGSEEYVKRMQIKRKEKEDLITKLDKQSRGDNYLKERAKKAKPPSFYTKEFKSFVERDIVFSAKISITPNQ